MKSNDAKPTHALPNGVMLNVYPDSVGKTLADTVSMLRRPEFNNLFSLLYIMPSFFNSDLDRGFSIIDYDRNENLSCEEDLKSLHKLNYVLKFDMVINHLSVGSPQFQDLLTNGDESPYKDFFVDWNEFWADKGDMSEDGWIIPKKEYLDQLFMRKPGLPILMVSFPDGTDRPYWNTFYQEITYKELFAEDLKHIKGLKPHQSETITTMVNAAIREKIDLNSVDFGHYATYKKAVLSTYKQHRKYLGQMDINAQSEQTWEFFDATL
ncbi:MAG: glycosidase, partial [Magnetococcales bacterium]|nr:glycosidase [Magnetococcales bacterium]